MLTCASKVDCENISGPLQGLPAEDDAGDGPVTAGGPLDILAVAGKEVIDTDTSMYSIKT